MKSLWRPPELRIEALESDTTERHATWLELFFDLVFVVAIAELAHNLSKDISILGFLSFLMLFVPIWWSWLNATYYSDLFDTDDLVHRLLTAANMTIVVALSVNLPHALDQTSANFALSYTAIRVLLIVKFLRAGWHVVRARPLAIRVAKSFGFAALLWLISVFVPPPLRFGLWLLGLAVELGMALTAGEAIHVKLAPHNSHLPERIGLFTIIVLGEAVTAVVRGLAEQQWNMTTAIAAILCFSIALSLWWIYFDNLGSSAIQAARSCRSIVAYQTWLYMHLPLTIGLTATSVGVEHAISSAAELTLLPSERWLMCIGTILCLVSLGTIYLTGLSDKARLRCKVRAMYRFGAAAMILVFGLGGSHLTPMELIGLIATVCAAQVLLDLRQSIVT